MNPDAIRRAALSRARQLANLARQEAQPSVSLHGIAPGDVLDYPELALFLAVTAIVPGCLCALGVRQLQPWTALKHVRMPANLVQFRLERRALKLVPDRNR